MIADEPLKVHDCHGLIELTPSAFRLAFMTADSTAHPWKRIGLFEYFIRVIDAVSTNQGNGCGDVHAYGTHVLTRAPEKL